MTDDSKRGQDGRWTAGEQFVSDAPLRFHGALYGALGAHTEEESGVVTDGGHVPDSADVPGHGRVGGVDDPVAREEYGDDPRDRPAHVRPANPALACRDRREAAEQLEQAAEVLRSGGNVADAKTLLDSAWHRMTDAEDVEGTPEA